ncbi:hypothetical protein J6X96_01605 [bacterium]|nr:hypothetical protein [bacterium]
MRKISLLMALCVSMAVLSAQAVIDLKGKLRIEVLDEENGSPVPGYEFSVSEDYNHTKIISTVKTDINGWGWGKKLKPGEYYIFNSGTSGGYAPYEGGGAFSFPAAGTSMVFKVKSGNKAALIDPPGSECTLKMSAIVTDETLGRIDADSEHRFFVSCKGNIFSDGFCIIPKGSDGYLKGKDISLNFKRKKTTLTFKIGPAYANNYFNLGTYSEDTPFVEELLPVNNFSGKNTNVHNQDKDPFNNSTVTFRHGWVKEPAMLGGMSFKFTDKGSQYSCDETTTVEGMKVTLKASVGKKNHKLKLTMKAYDCIGCNFRFTKNEDK